MHHWKSWFTFVIITSLIINEFVVITEARRGGGGGGWGRGGSFGGRRVNSNQQRSRNGGFLNRVLPGKSTGGARIPNINAGSAGRRVGGGASRGVGRSAFTGLLAGLAAGYVGAKVGRHLAGGWYSGRYYWFGDRYYYGPGSHRIRCTIVAPNNFTMSYEDGARVKEIIYECDRYRESCCDQGCCYHY